MANQPGSLQQRVHYAADIVRDSQRVVVLTGAGISTPSGIPDFRSPDSGLWDKHDPIEVASLSAFRYSPERFYDWLHTLAREIVAAQPNPAHLGIAALERAGYIKTVITQNIDGLHQKAGSTDVLEVHGSLTTLTCVGCYRKVSSEGYIRPYLDGGVIPHCPVCNKLLKPDVVLFGEQLPVRTWLKAQEASKKCDLMIAAGSSLEVLPVAGLPMRALENGAHLIIINRSKTYLDVRADVVFPEDVAEVFPLVTAEVIGV
jgi:NAD-dependent deacetylase